jgi:hypothetical protein
LYFLGKLNQRRYDELDIVFDVDKQTERERERERESEREREGYIFSSSYSLVSNRLNI